jgi:hypothetical protein
MMSSVEIVQATYADIAHIARHMRDLDAEEIYPLLWKPTAENLAAGTVAAGGISYAALCDGEPVATWGAHPLRPKVWIVWMFATDRWPRVALSVTRQIKTKMIPTLIDAGAVRAECFSMEGHDVAHRWLEVLGAVCESSVEDYGQNRKTYHCYSWTRSRLERDHVFRFPKSAGPAGASPGSPAASDAG